uniref:Claudin n=1 Tax=Sander lucioperca TaxID=283035 RepID=A0A8C9WWG4_SANLU
MEIGCFVVCVSGWMLVCSTLPIDIWTWSELDSIVLGTSNYFSNLWKDCMSDSTGVTDCKDIPSLLALNWDIHMCRALIIISIILAFFGSVLVLVGMKCTKIGGSEIVNARLTFAGGMNYLIGGMCSMIAFSYYGNKLRAEFQDPNYKAQKYVKGSWIKYTTNSPYFMNQHSYEGRIRLVRAENQGPPVAAEAAASLGSQPPPICQL